MEIVEIWQSLKKKRNTDMIFLPYTINCGVENNKHIAFEILQENIKWTIFLLVEKMSTSGENESLLIRSFLLFSFTHLDPYHTTFLIELLANRCQRKLEICIKL